MLEMDVKLIDTIRICFLSFLQTRIADIEPHSIKCGKEAVEQILQKIA